jgi:hypothetical protein
MNRIAQTFCIQLELDDLFEHGTLRALSTKVDGLVGKEGTPTVIGITPVAEAPDYAVSFSQRRLWLLGSLGLGSRTAYNMYHCYRLLGMLDRAALDQALGSLSVRHESLRTTFFVNEGGEIRQRISLAGDRGIRVEYLNAPEGAAEDSSSAGSKIDHWITSGLEELRHEDFDLERGPLLKVRVLSVGAEEQIFLLSMHHIIGDGWSFGVLFRELSELYNGYHTGVRPQLAPLAIQYRDYAEWQQKELSADRLEVHRRYWQQQLSGNYPLADVLSDRRRPSVRSYRGASRSVQLGREVLSGLEALGREQGASLFMTLTATVKVLLYKYLGTEDLTIGTVTAGRDRRELEEQVGFYVNTLVLRTRAEGSKGFRSWLGAVREVILGAYEHQVYPFDQLVEDFQQGGELSRTPLFDVMVVLQNGAEVRGSGQGLSGLEIKEYALSTQTSKFDLLISFTEREAGLEVSIDYDTELYKEARILRMLEHYRRLTTSILTQGDVAVEQLLYRGEEESALSEGINRASLEAASPYRGRVEARFREIVAEHGSRIAVESPSGPLTYNELEGRAAALSGYLQEAGVREGDLVGLLMDRGAGCVVSMLGILQLGGGYMPMETGYPSARIGYMLSDSGSRVVLTEGQEPQGGWPAGDYRVIDIRTIKEDRGARSPLPLKGGEESVAYLMYTSGSTGQPKGVRIPHRGITRLVLSPNYMELYPTDRLLAGGSLCF